MAELSAILVTLGELLEARNPELSRALAAPASSEALTRLSQTVGTPLPADVTAWFSWHDGTSDTTSFALGENWYALSTEKVLEAWYFLGDPGEDILPPWERTWLPLFANGAGDHLCVDLASGKVLEYRHDDPARPTVAKSLGAWLTRVARAYAKAKAPTRLSPPVTVTGVGPWRPLASPPDEKTLAACPLGAAVRHRFQRNWTVPLSWYVYVKVGRDLWCEGAGVELDAAFADVNRKLAKPFSYGWPKTSDTVASSLKFRAEMDDATEHAEARCELCAPRNAVAS